MNIRMITSDGLKIHDNTAVKLLDGSSDEGNPNAYVELWKAREADDTAEPTGWIYFAETNGDPIYIGCIDDDGTIYHMTEDTAVDGRPNWEEVLEWFGFFGDTTDDARDFLMGLK